MPSNSSVEGKVTSYQNLSFAKTIVIGDNSDILKRIIFVLSYFLCFSNHSTHSHFSNNMNDLSGQTNISRVNENYTNAADDVRIVPLNSILDNNKDVKTFGDIKETLETKNDKPFLACNLDLSMPNHLQKKVSFMVGSSNDISIATKHPDNIHNKESPTKVDKSDGHNLPRVRIVSVPKSIRLV